MAVTPLGRVLVDSVMLPVKFVRVRVTEMLLALPPRVSVTDFGLTLLIAMLGTGFTVRLKVAVTEDTPLPLAVMVIVSLLTSVALLEAFRVMLPEFPVLGCE